jgi:CMP-N-acetylneuraminic acid synthetase
VIPARGGSKGVPNKNIRLLDGRPLISYIINTAKDSGIFDTIVTTTDSEKIADVARMYGSQVIMRPPELAKDDALVEDAMVHALSQLSKHDYVALLEPTSPLLIGRDILGAVKKLVEKKADMVLSICKATSDMVMIGRLGKNGSLKNFLPKDLRTCPRQKRPTYYYLNGAIYIGKWNIFARKKDFYEQDTIAFEMHPEDHIHIDTEVDWINVERALEKRKWAKAALA